MLLQRQEKSVAKAQARLIAVKNQHLSAVADSEMEGQESDESEEIELASNHASINGNQHFVNQAQFGSAVRQLGNNLTNVRLNSAEMSGKSSALKAAQQRQKNARANVITTVQN